MDILKRSLAPITAAAWAEIDDVARNVLSNALTARKVVDFEGPMGWEYAALPMGRLTLPAKQPVEGVEFGIRTVQPLTELRVPFELGIWEIDNIVRGAKDIDLAPMEEAARTLARFEDRAVFYGLEHAAIAGLKDSAEESMPLPDKTEGIIATVTRGLGKFMEKAVGGPYAMVVSPQIWQLLTGHVEGYPLNKYLASMLEGPIVVTPHVEDAFLVSMRGGDNEMVVGQDIAIGYNSNDKEKVQLFFTESFTFHSLDPAATICLPYNG